jgi:hypothetical protein
MAAAGKRGKVITKQCRKWEGDGGSMQSNAPGSALIAKPHAAEREVKPVMLPLRNL